MKREKGVYSVLLHCRVCLVRAFTDRGSSHVCEERYEVLVVGQWEYEIVLERGGSMREHGWGRAE
jgi:hypothetical protein